MASRGVNGPAAAVASRADGKHISSSVFVRIRPLSTGDKDGHTEGEAVAKKMKRWDDTTITFQDDDIGQQKKYDMTQVVGPELDQEQAFEKMMPELIEDFKADTNVMFYAYGQTGSGKTHTMLGEIESLSSPVPVAGWGIFPRVVHSTLESMKEWQGNGTKSILLATAVEFYCCAGWDLSSQYVDAKNMVSIDRNANIFGAASKEITSTKQLKKWVKRMYANRTTAKTKMNDASSRSHCAFILTLHKLLPDDTYVKTIFSLIDMAGSERSDKTGGERINGDAASAEAKKMLADGTPEKLSVGAQGFMINWEISHITTEMQKAAETHKKGMPYKAQKAMSTAASLYFCGNCDGRSRIAACVTISQSPQHGFESWFSLNYGEKLAAFKGPLYRVKPEPMDKELAKATEEAEEAAKKLAGANPNPMGAAQMMGHMAMEGEANHTAETLMVLQRLVDEKAGQVAGADGEDSSSGDEYVPMRMKKAFKAQAVKVPGKSALELGKINENFQVFIRIRPLLEREIKAGAKNCFTVTDIEFPRVPPPQRITVESPDPSQNGHTYVFNRVFEESHGQQDVYEGVAKPYVTDFLNGTNVTLFAYGQTGTGKTHTITGSAENPGLIKRCLEDILAGLPATGKELRYEFVQLYQMNDWKDLLVTESKGELKLIELKNGGVYLQGVDSRKASDLSTVLADLKAGMGRRATRAQDMNEVSSRSHAVLMLRLVEPGKQPDEADASMFIVDLAGSERISRSGVTGQGFDEATAINQSLTSLGRVVTSLIENANNSKAFIPYNGSQLTMILKGGLGGNSKTGLIACVTQAGDSMSESVNTLRFAMQASHVKNKVDKADAQKKEDDAKAKKADSGNALTLADGKATVELTTGSLEVRGVWDTAEGASSDRIVILLSDSGAKGLDATQGLVDALGGVGCQVLAVQLGGNGDKELEEDCKKLLALLDWLGVSKPAVYGRDWGGVQAIKFKILHPARVGALILENRRDRFDEKEYKAMMKKDPGCMMRLYGFQTFAWILDYTWPKDFNKGPAGANFKGFKGKATLLFPFQSCGTERPAVWKPIADSSASVKGSFNSPGT
eukprot:TRINITY_DN16815_c0_g1_i2.p1 TRINITY_DN16815_c0_g1~~TRINITY_DN16815_c0_g1_i2.p1  ORF type:complete len:1107 (+),score=237.16 TRINITY_DN16815_c0_g1_i2:88-3321(+)